MLLLCQTAFAPGWYLKCSPCSLTRAHMNQRPSVAVIQNVQIHSVRLWSLFHCVLFLHSSAGYQSLGTSCLHASLSVS